MAPSSHLIQQGSVALHQFQMGAQRFKPALHRLGGQIPVRGNFSGQLREIMDIMLDAVCSTAPTIRINGEDMPQQVVKSRFLKLNSSHIEYVLDAMNKNPSDIRNIRAYLLTALYNASLTIDNYYSALVNHDFYGQDRSAGSKKPKTYDYSLCEDTL